MSLGCSPLTLSGDAAVLIRAHRLAALRAHESVFLTSGGVTAIGTGERYGAALDGVLTRPIAFRDDVHITAWLSGWHGQSSYFWSGTEANGCLHPWHRSRSESNRISVAAVWTCPQCGQLQVGFGGAACYVSSSQRTRLV